MAVSSSRSMCFLFASECRSYLFFSIIIVEPYTFAIFYIDHAVIRNYWYRFDSLKFELPMPIVFWKLPKFTRSRPNRASRNQRKTTKIRAVFVGRRCAQKQHKSHSQIGELWKKRRVRNMLHIYIMYRWWRYIAHNNYSYIFLGNIFWIFKII